MSNLPSLRPALFNRAASTPAVRRRSALLHSVSISALVVAAAVPRAAEASGFRSLNQALAIAGRAAQQAVAPSNGVTASQQAALGAQNVANAATRFRSLADALNNLSTHPGTPSPIVVDGYGPGTGLQSAPGAVAGNSLWQGAALPTTKTTSTGITVTVTQNQALAQLTWQTFNVGAKTTLNFDQSAGGTLASSWVVINTVQDPLANASQILGSINAPGKVYVLNRNGIAFTRGATINVGSLIAATSDIAASQFTTSLNGQTSFDLYGAQTVGTDPVSGVATYYQPTFVNGTAAAITVAPGAVIETAAPTGTNGGGYVMLLGGNVSNGGIISTPLGQTVLAAGTAFTLRQGTTGSTTAGNVLSTTLGSEVAATNYGTNAAGQLTIDPTTGVYNTGSVTNSGVIVADQGDISLVGHALLQSGVLLSTTTVNQRGTIHFLTPDDGSDLSASITLAPGSVTEILPEDNGETALDSQRATDISTSQTLNALRANLVTATGEIGSAANPVLNNTNTLADQIEESRVEISTGGAVDVGSGALVLAQGGQIAVNGGAKILLENGANLDVSGTTNSVMSGNVNAFNLNLGSNNGTPTALSPSVLDLLVNVEPFQTRDSPTNRSGGLKGTNVYIDLASLVEISSGAYAGNIYTAGGLLEVGGYLGLVPHSIGEWSAIGGQVTLQAQQTVITPPASATGTATYSRVAGTVITDPGSVINLQGGTVNYTAGLIPQTYVQAADGAVYNINDAPGNLVYTGLYVGDQVTHARWKTTYDFLNPLLTPAEIAMPAYTVGRDAGSITVNAQTSVIQGAIDAGVTLGQYQDSVRPAAVTDPYLLAQSVVPQAGSLFVGNYLTSVLQTYTTPTQVVFQSTQGPITPVQGTAIFDAPALNADGFANIVLSTGGNITVNSALSVANGGTISLTGADVTVNADITARSGAIVLTDQLSAYPGPVAPHTTLTLASGAVLDTRGVWTNEKLDPNQIASAAYANGGRVTIAGSNGVTLQTGSRIDVSSGGGLLSNGQTLTGRGGSVSITADIPEVASSAGQAYQTVDVSSTIVGYGSNGGGTFSLAVPLVRIGSGGPSSVLVTVLDPSLFSTGFSKYVVDGVIGLTVTPGTQITVAEPIYELTQGLALPTGSDPASAYSIGLPLLYSPNKGTDQIAQRAGASISLFSAEGGNTGLFPNLSAGAGGGSVSIGAGASISVDPGQSITVAGFGQVTVSGSLIAHGGSVTVANTNFVVDQQIVTPGTYTASSYVPGVSVWLDSGSLIDVSGQAIVMTDLLGRTFGLAPAGGAITLGSLEPSLPTLAQVIERPGAVLDADGAQATVDVVQGADTPSVVPRSTPVTLVGNGGSVAADSITGVALDGSVTAHAGGLGAAGGTLALTLDPSNLGQYGNIPTDVYQPQEIVVTQATVATQPATGLAPGQASPADTFGLIRVSQQQIDAGGFASLDLAAQTAAILFDGNVALHTSRSIVLSSGVIGGTSAAGSVSIAAPYVELAGETTENIASNPPSLPATPSTAVLTITADLIDQSGSVFLGGSTIVSLPNELSGTPAPGFGPPGQIVVATAQGFGQVNIVSTGDIRFLGSDNRSAGIGTLASIGNITFDAAQLYPVSGQASEVIAGATAQAGNTLPATSGGTIVIHGTGTTPQAPYSVGGSLTFVADQIEQGGIVRAPEGTIAFTDGFTGNGTVYPSQVAFAAGSVTSVSLYGQVIPYGGTVDGVTYTAPGGGSPALFQPTISAQAQAVDVQDGATIDLRGGGTLTGAGFVFGRGGTADVLTTPLLDISGGAAVANAQAQVAAIQPVRTNDPVYAILPGYQSSYAPAAGRGDTGYTATQIGEQVTVAANTVPGLAAGTYTLLPAYYALLPGAFRVELTTATLPPGFSLPQGNYTIAAPVSLSVANTTIAAPVPTEALFTSGTNVRQLSQYDEETYNNFEASSATQFGAPRPFLPQDAKTLQLTYPTAIGTQTALAFAPSALLDAPATGGYGATLEIGFTNTTGVNTIAVSGAPAPPTVYPGAQLLLQASTLDALDFSRLVLGGLLTQDARAVDTQDLIASAGAVYILNGATLSAGDVMVTTLAGGTIDVLKGGTISTIGAGPAAFDNTEGFFINNEVFTGQAIPVLDVSNGRIVFTPNTDSAPGSSIVINNGAGLLAGGSLDIVAPNGAVVTIGTANIGAKYASIAAAAINIGSQSALDTYAGQLPQGFDVTPAALTALLTGSAALGTPAASVLTLTATQEVNILGSVALNSGTTDLVLNTPAIYGVGAATDVASITAPEFTWSGVQTQITNLLGNPQDSSALPGGQIAAGLNGHAIGQFSITAGTIVLGYGPQTQPNDQVLLQRTVAGFDNVTLTGTSEITANNQSGLTVYANQKQIGAVGTGGDLTLVSPLVTTDSGAVLDLTAGGAVNLQAPAGGTPAATATVATLGGEISIVSGTVDVSTAVALHSGQFNITAQNGIDLASTGVVDLSGAAVHLLDQTVYTTGGTLAFESTAGSITLDAGSHINVSATGTSAGSVSFNALAGGVAVDGTLLGSANAGQTGGSFTVIAGTLATSTQASNVAAGGSAFDNINAGLNTGGFTGSRDFELGTDIGPGGNARTDLVIDNDTSGASLLAASTVTVTTDLGSIDVTGIINASGIGPGSIALYAAKNLTLETTAVLDAHATQTAVDSYGNPIDAENRAHVTLTSTAGSLTLNGGTINLTYPGYNTALGTPQGQLVLNAPRVGGTTGGDVAINARAPINIEGAQSIALYAWTTYQALDSNGTILQLSNSPNVVSLDSINQDNQAFMTAAGTNAALAQRLAGLITYGTTFHLRPGVEIDSNAASGGTLTIGGDLDLSAFRYSDVGYGTQVDNAVYGSGEAGAILFRAANDLVVNGSVTDGFAPPPDEKTPLHLVGDSGWLIQAPSIAVSGVGAADPLAADIVLPASITVKEASGLIVHRVELAAGTTFDETRDVSLNYAITILAASVRANTVIPFAATLDPNGSGVTIPQGGFVTTGKIVLASGQVIPAGTYLAGGTVIAPGSTIAAGSSFPVDVGVADNTVVPAGTPLSIFDDQTSTLTLAANTALLPVNAFLPSNTAPQFVTSDGTVVGKLELRPVGTDAAGQPTQGYLYALSAMLPAGSQSWDLDLVAGANQASADPNAVTPRSVLDGGALAPAANTANQAPGSLILDDQHYYTDPINPLAANPAFSVLRTGTGDLTLVAGGNFDQSSLFGIYTAGTQDPLAGGAAANDPFDLGRENYNATNGRQGVVPGGPQATINRIISQTYQANYPTDGGDVLLSAQGSVTGDVYGGTGVTGTLLPSDAVGNWLWRQGSTQLGQPSAWWINFGTFVIPYQASESGYINSSTMPQLVGFQGIGALGGGNVTVIAGQNAGQTTDRQGNNAVSGQLRGEGLIVAVGSTGREVSANGTASIVQTGGGHLTIHVGGTLNPLDAQAYGTTGGQSDLNGLVLNLRGTIDLTAGAVGRLDETYSSIGLTNEPDPRPIDPYTAQLAPSDGITVMPGDATVDITTQRDLVLDGVGDPGRVNEQNLTRLTQAQVGAALSTAGGATGFTLWTADTAVSLFSTGGNAAPITNTTTPQTQQVSINNDGPTDDRFIYPSQLYVTATSGNITWGAGSDISGNPNVYSLEVAPSVNEQVAFLAGRSIQGNGMAIDLSGANPAGLSTPLDPAFTSFASVQSSALTNILPGGGTQQSVSALFAQEADTPTGNYLGAKAQATPALFYAANGDILDLVTGETLSFNSTAQETLTQWYLAAKPVRIIASNDIVASGTRPAGPAGTLQQNAQATPDGFSTASGDLFLNNSAQSISVVSAGRDILSGYFYVGGPGLLEVDAGRNLQQIGYSVTAGSSTVQLLDYGSIKSLGSLFSGAPISLTGGASIDVSAGLGSGADYTAFADLYLNPANQANLALQITDPANAGKVQEVYAAQLLTWLQQNYGYTGTQAGALAYFLNPANVPQANQDAFLRNIFYAELLASGQQYNDPNSRFHLSYTRGRQAIDALFPGTNGQTSKDGTPAGYTGAITMASGTVAPTAVAPTSGVFDAGVATEHGGDIDVLAPGGQVVLGTTGATFPGGGTGLITNGSGNINVFSNGSVLLGKSRIFTNAGGNIQIWSATGDINAGIGARTTVVYNPPVISYDNAGGIVESPAIPTSGSGIATNQPLPSVPVGNIDLTAPLGTIDAGEAGVRSSGNLNLAASRLANTAGFSAGGKTSGNSAAPSVSLGAVEAAGAAAGASQAAGQNLNNGRNDNQLPSVIEVEVISVSGESEEERRKKRGM